MMVSSKKRLQVFVEDVGTNELSKESTKKLKTFQSLFRPLRSTEETLSNDDGGTIVDTFDWSDFDHSRRSCPRTVNAVGNPEDSGDDRSGEESEVSTSDSGGEGLVKEKHLNKNEANNHGQDIKQNQLLKPSKHSAVYASQVVDEETSSKHEESKDSTAEESSVKSFRELGVCEELCIACDALNWKQPTEIQTASIPYALEDRDLIGLAQTGSGKTGAFAIPIIQKLLDQPNHKGVFALVLAPTRELTVQIAEHFRALGAAISLKVCTIVGGLDMVAQTLELAKRQHVIVGTPGRVVDHLEHTKGFGLGTLRYFVMDEADRLLSMDFEEPINRILDVLPKDRNTYLFSATMTSRVSKLQRASLVKPAKVEICSKFDTAKNLVQLMKLIQHKEKWSYLVGLVTYFKTYSIMIFVNTCDDAGRLAMCVRKLGFESICLHGKMSQPQRLGALNSFKSGRKKVLVATEVGSRGLDIPCVDVVINFDVPLNSKDYIHRVGRTARAGRSGKAITLVTQYDIEAFQRIEHSLNKRLDIFESLSDDVWKSNSEEVSQARRLAELEIKDQASVNKKRKRQFQKKRR